MYLVTLGHFFASSCASALVTLRQLLSPKPSASASVIFLLPHQDGAPATGLPPPPLAAPSPPPPSPPPHAATTSAAIATAAGAPILARALRADLIIDSSSSGWTPILLLATRCGCIALVPVGSASAGRMSVARC